MKKQPIPDKLAKEIILSFCNVQHST